MQASKLWQATYLPYALMGASLLLGMAVKDILFNSWTLFPASPTKTIMPADMPPQSSTGVLSPEAVDTLFTDADNLFRQNEVDAAIRKYKDILNRDHSSVMALMRLGAASCRLDRYEQAEYFYRTAVSLQPSLTLAYIKLGLVQHKLNKHEQALRTFTAVLLIQPDNIEGIFNISKVYADLDHYDKAIQYAKKAIEMEPDNVHTHLNLGHIYNKQGDTQAACTQYENAIKVDPELANAHYNLGYTLRVQQEPKKALPHLFKALELQPDYPDAHIALAQAYWTFGDFKTAWQHYEWRWRQLGIDPKALDTPLWDGTPLDGKTILLYSEQGMGDTLQFIRYAKKIKEEYGGHVICKVQKPLQKLIQMCPYIDKVVTSVEDEQTPLAAQAPLLNLPGILETTVDTIPHPVPYLYADKELVTHWKKKLAGDKNIKVGLCWHVLPAHETTKSPLSLRSIELNMLAPLADIPGVSFYSLQKMDGVDQVLYTPDRFKVHTFGGDFDESHGRFMDTAAIIENLDLVISVDTSIIHLAGGLGKDIWTLLSFSPDCRWDHDAHSTPWYNSMRLFRQSAWNDWHTVVMNVKEALQEFVKQKRKPASA